MARSLSWQGVSRRNKESLIARSLMSRGVRSLLRGVSCEEEESLARGLSLLRSLVQRTYVRYIGTVSWSKTKSNVPGDFFLTEPSVNENR